MLSTILTQFHAYKQRHVADVSAWHRSYRAQLAEARAENERLREQIWDMQEHAGRANAMLREFRRRFDGEMTAAVNNAEQPEQNVQNEQGGGGGNNNNDNKRGGDGRKGEGEETKEKEKGKDEKSGKTPGGTGYWARRVDDRARRQELRFWKRMAMPEIDDDDPFWSDDDDLIDPAEKERLSEIERRVAEQVLAGAVGSGSGSGAGSGEEHGGEDSDGETAALVIVHRPAPATAAAAVAAVTATATATAQPVAVPAFGGVAMERDSAGGSSSGSGEEVIPAPPSRPASTGSTGGRTG